MTSSSAPVSVLDEHRFRKEFNQELFNSHARKKKVIPEVGFNLNEDEYPQIMEQVALRGWRRLAAPRTNVSELMMQEFYANAAVSEEEAAEQDELPYKSFVRGIKVDFSPSNIRRVMRFKSTTEGAETDSNTRKAMDQRLDEVLRDLCIPGATWKLSSSQPAVAIQLKRTKLHPLAKGWQEFIIHSLVPTGNKSEATTTRAILIHSIMQGEDDAGVPLREFRRTPRIPELSYITAKRMETIRFPRHQPQQQHEDDDEDEPMPQADGGTEEGEEQQQPQQEDHQQQHGFPNFQPRYESQYHEDLQGIEETLSSMQFFQQTFYENMNTSAREAYTCWAHQQANPNLSEIPITQIPDIMQTNAEKGRPMFYGCLKSDYGASSSSQVDPNEPAPLRTAPHSPDFCPPHPPPN
ncbi:hypothetical protein PIB30_087416 [Stylosanthes scabra]|uniref:Putative plant transposon protein domain-containing protein n=1 Tax=Stylosanthes scabra TaxID=79078 RepID=A0ABU6ZS44_9FABA|nr:hypothetical protein [Stylosanthes scabra]